MKRSLIITIIVALVAVSAWAEVAKYLEKTETVTTTVTAGAWVLTEIRVDVLAGTAIVTFYGYADKASAKAVGQPITIKTKTVVLADIPNYAQIDTIVSAYVLTIPEFVGGEIKSTE